MSLRSTFGFLDDGSEEILSWDHIIDICTAYGFLIARWTDIVSIRANNRAVLHHGSSFF